MKKGDFEPATNRTSFVGRLKLGGSPILWLLVGIILTGVAIRFLPIIEDGVSETTTSTKTVMPDTGQQNAELRTDLVQDEGATETIDEAPKPTTPVDLEIAVEAPAQTSEEQVSPTATVASFIRGKSSQAIESQLNDITTEEVFSDIFQNATKIDRFSIEDPVNCRTVSGYEVEDGDEVRAEIALARKEDAKSPSLSLQGGTFTFMRGDERDTPEDHLREWDIQLEPATRTIANLWNESTEGNYSIGVYRLGIDLETITREWQDYDSDIEVGRKIQGGGYFAPGIYEVRLWSEDTGQSCSRFLRNIDVTNLVEDSVLVAWYVKFDTF